jgi:hypothetical protein
MVVVRSAAMRRTIRSPDGRSWRLERVRPESGLSATRKEPMFWASVVATVVLIAFIVLVIVVFDSTILRLLAILVLAIWLIERGVNLARPNIRAHTDGPPAETLTWRTTHRYGLSRIEDRIAQQIESGRLEGEPPGAVLIGI